MNKKIFLTLALTSFILISLIGIDALQDSNGNIVLGIWYNSNTATNTMTIQDGQPVDFSIYALALGSALTVDVDLIKQNGEIVEIHSVQKSSQDYNEFMKGYSIGQSTYGGIGNHKIRLTVKGIQTDTLELNLNVVANPPAPQNNAPVFISAPLITVIENQA